MVTRSFFGQNKSDKSQNSTDQFKVKTLNHVNCSSDVFFAYDRLLPRLILLEWDKFLDGCIAFEGVPDGTLGFVETTKNSKGIYF